jgi:hypothetical protein
MAGTRSRAVRRGTSINANKRHIRCTRARGYGRSRKRASKRATPDRAGARPERVPTIAVRRDLHVFPYVDAHGLPPDVIFCGLGSEMRISLDQNRVDEPAHRFRLVVN